MTTNPSFSKTCNRFSQYLKEMRLQGAGGDPHHFGFPNLPSSPNLVINGTVREICEATNDNMKLNLFPEIVEMKNQHRNVEKVKSLNLFPLVSSSADFEQEDSSTKNMAISRECPILKEKEEMPMASTRSMTIFYNGRVVTFDDLPEDKAQEVMALASQAMINSPPQTQTQTQTQTPTPTSILPMNNSPITSDIIPILPMNNSPISSDITPSVAFAGLYSNLPVMRRASLHRFMEKRRDRFAATVPYQLYYNSSKGMDKSNSRHERKNLMKKFEQRLEQEQVQVQLQAQDLELKL